MADTVSLSLNSVQTSSVDLHRPDGLIEPLTAKPLYPLFKDVLVVAPYSAWVRLLKSKLPTGARVATVDKFQGQEASVVFFSMTSSSGEDVPRGMNSSSIALAVVVCSPRLLWSRCGTVEQMRLVNMLCRFGEWAARAAVPL